MAASGENVEVERRGRRQLGQRIELLISGGIGVLALFVSAYTVYIQRQQLKVQAWPSLDFGGESRQGPNGAGLESELWLKNLGVAPAQVRAARVAVGGEPMTDWNAALARIGEREHVAGPFPTSRNRSPVGSVISVGQSFSLMVTDSLVTAALLSRTEELRVSVCYCSMLEDCWVLEATSGGESSTTAIGACPAYSPPFVTVLTAPDRTWADSVLRARTAGVVADAGSDGR